MSAQTPARDGQESSENACLVEVDRAQLASWLERFGRAWETRDPDLVAPLFSDDGSYQETPFDVPLTGAAAIRARWSSLPKARPGIRFAYDILAVTEQWGIAHWRGSYIPADRDAQVELDGILLISLDEAGHCRHFREWSSRRTKP